MRPTIGLFALALLGACQQKTNQTSATGNAVSPAAVASANEAANQAVPAARTPLAETKGPIDPKSTEAAGQIVQHYGALIEQGRWKDAATYWGDGKEASSFAKELRERGLKHVEIGELGKPEGAAGSVYVTMPVVFYEGSKREAAEIILRRVNDVPGSTEAHRRWHIERIEWKP